MGKDRPDGDPRRRNSTDRDSHDSHHDDRSKNRRKSKDRKKQSREENEDSVKHHSSSDEYSHRRGDERKKRRRRSPPRKSAKKRRHSRHREDESDNHSYSSRGSDESYERHHDRKRKKKRKHDDESVSDDESYRRHRSKDRKKKKRKRSESKGERSSKGEKRSSKDKRGSKQVDATIPPGAGSYGQYGIIKASDFLKQQRSFEVWLAEVKKVPAFSGPKWELQNYFADYCEDFNTGTLPHIKYYDYDDWEMKEYRRQSELEKERHQHGGIAADEARHQELMRKRAKEKQETEADLLRSSMSADKIQDMKRKAQLQSEMAHAFKTGDEETVKRIQRKLEPDAR